MIKLITLEDGRKFPEFEGKPLSWSIGSYHTWEEQQKGFPKMRTVIRALLQERPSQVERERRELVRASFDPMFGMNAKRELEVVEEEIERYINSLRGMK